MANELYKSNTKCSKQFIAELRARKAPQQRDFGKPISARNFGFVMTSLASDRPYVRNEMRHSNPVLQPGFFRREVGWPNSFRKTNENFEEN